MHFVALGVLVFALQWALVDREDPSLIEVDRAVEADIQRQLAERIGRVPDDDELERAVEAWIQTEVLVREARRLGLDRNDPVVRERLAEKMVFVAGSVEIVPSEQALLDEYEAAADPTASFEQWRAARAAGALMDRYRVLRSR